MRYKFIICISFSTLISFIKVSAQDTDVPDAYMGIQVAGSTGPYSIRFGVKVYDSFYIEPGIGLFSLNQNRETRNFNHYSIEGIYYSKRSLFSGAWVFGLGVASASNAEWMYGRIGYYTSFLSKAFTLRICIVPALTMDLYEDPPERWIPLEGSFFFNF